MVSKRAIRVAALVTLVALLSLVLFASLSVRRGEPPLSLLRKVRPYKVEEGWQHYRLTMTADDLLKRGEAELRSPDLQLGAADYGTDQGLECWTFLRVNGWTIEFREANKPKAKPVLEVQVHREPPAWLAWIHEKLGFTN